MKHRYAILTMLLAVVALCGCISSDAPAEHVDAWAAPQASVRPVGALFPGGDIYAPFTVTVQGASPATLASLNNASGDFVAAGAGNLAGTGLFRAPNAATLLTSRNAGNSADISVLATDGSNDILLGDGTNAASIQVQNGTVEWASAAAAPTLTQLGESTATKGADMIIEPQQSTHATDQGGGHLRILLQTPTGAGVDDYVKIENPSGTPLVQLGRLTGDAGFGAIWLGNVTPAANNSAIYASSASSVAIANGSLVVQNSTTQSSSSIGIASGLQVGATSLAVGGCTGGCLGITNDTGNPSSNPSGGGVVYENSGELSHRGSGGAIYEIAPPGTGSINSQTATWQRRTAFLRTSASSAQTVFTTPSIASSHVLTIKAVFTSNDQTTIANAAGAEIAATFYNSAGTVTQVGSTTTIFNNNYTNPPVFAISGTTILVQVKANATNNTDTQVDVYMSVD